MTTATKKQTGIAFVAAVLAVAVGGYFWHQHRTPAAYVDRGYLLQNQGRYRDAVSDFRVAADLQPDSAKAHAELGDALQSIDYKVEPAGWLGMATVGNPAPPKELNEAIAEYRKAIQLDPKDAFYHSELASSLDAQGNRIEAIAEYHRTIMLLPAYAATPWEQEVMTQADAQAHMNANQKYHDACWCLAEGLQKQRKFGEAIAWYRRSIASKPDDNSTRMMLAKALNEDGKRQEARQVWQQVVHHDDQGEAPEARRLLAKYPEQP